MHYYLLLRKAADLEVPATNALHIERRPILASYGYTYSCDRTKLSLGTSLLAGKCGGVADLDVRSSPFANQAMS